MEIILSILCFMLHDFVGNIEMYGVLDVVTSSRFDARTIGVGMCMEGIEHNPVVYELMHEMAFRRGNNFRAILLTL
ncbi:hypothetical protein EJD97_024874, partial [Solanum chilense]